MIILLARWPNRTGFSSNAKILRAGKRNCARQVGPYLSLRGEAPEAVMAPLMLILLV